MRINNDMVCDLAALVEYDDSSLRRQDEIKNGKAKGTLSGRFLRYASIPGLGVAHPAILYDEVCVLNIQGSWL